MKTENVKVSKHARKRIKERCGVGKSSVDRIANLAVERGVDRLNTKGPLRKWLDMKFARDSCGTIYVWGDKAFLISDKNKVITVLYIPNELKRNMNRMIVQPA